MAADFWKNAVESYLCVDQGTFLHPHYLVGEDVDTAKRPTFLAIDLPRRRVWVVEVAKAQSRELLSRIDAFQARSAPTIRAQLESRGIVRGTEPWSEWSLGVWVFAPRSSLSELRSRAVQAGIVTGEFTPLEEVVTTIAARDFGEKAPIRHA